MTATEKKTGKKTAAVDPAALEEISRSVAHAMLAYVDLVLKARAKKRGWLPALRLASRYFSDDYAGLTTAADLEAQRVVRRVTALRESFLELLDRAEVQAEVRALALDPDAARTDAALLAAVRTHRPEILSATESA